MELFDDYNFIQVDTTNNINNNKIFDLMWPVLGHKKYIKCNPFKKYVWIYFFPPKKQSFS